MSKFKLRLQMQGEYEKHKRVWLKIKYLIICLLGKIIFVSF